MSQPGLIITCEHASAAIPPIWRDVFKGQTGILKTHRAIDIGALSQAKALAREFNAPLYAGRISRLLVDLNRSEGNKGFFSEFSQTLSESDRQALLDQYWRPFRQEVRKEIEAILCVRVSVLHLSMHSFTPVLNEKIRHADMGLLYDPSRVQERDLCHVWAEHLQVRWPHGRIRHNYPYSGLADGHTTFLRTQFPDSRYIGIEIEVNQRLMPNAATRMRALRALVGSLKESLAIFDSPDGGICISLN